MADPTTYADRYEIVQPIARGGMANVYLARDTKLDRVVALKVLPAELSRDTTFVERFRLEAQAAASLNEATIVAVYDWGQEAETSFIVMEYVEGSTLREEIAKGPLAPVAAARIGADIAKALEAAHRAGVIHRDVKPGNVLLTPTNQVKVTDFGIARANGMGDGLTRTGAVMGTATYFSPEQAQGFPVDARSDVYALGVVLYEMVTGEVPFVGDSPVSVAYLHVREPVTAPSTRRADLPEPFERIVLTCLAKDPAARYQTADELRADLLRFSRGEAVRGGPALTALVAETDATTAMARTSIIPTTTTALATPRRRKGPIALVIAFLVALIAVVGFLLFSVFQDTETAGRVVTVPDVVGKSETEARDILERRGFEVRVREEPNSAPPGQVFDQDPDDGQLQRTGTPVTISVSTGGVTVTVPRVAGLDQLTAQKRLEELEFVVSIVAERSETVDKGIVIRTAPKAGTRLDPGSGVTLIVSAGKEPIPVPDVSGLDQVEATQRLVLAGFKVASSVEPSRDVDAGRVIRTEPAAGTPLDPESTVTLIVSSGTNQVDVPDVVGQTQGIATNALRGAGFVVNVVNTVASPANVGRVISQNPAGGGKADEGSTVTITVGVAATTTTSSTTTSTTTTTTPP